MYNLTDIISLHEEDVGYKETNMDSLWYLDNEASNHMTGVREHFKELDEKVSGKVRFGDGSYIEIKEDVTIDTFTRKLTTLVNKAASLGHTIEDQTLVRKLLNFVPDRYLQIVVSIDQYSDLSEMTMEEEIRRLKTYEERIKYKNGKQVDNQEKLMFTRHESKRKYLEDVDVENIDFHKEKPTKNLRKKRKMENPLIGTLIETTLRNQAMILANYNVSNVRR
nr:zinc finger, CCHC-type [Tanacetum cinerariifolium]